MPHYPRLFSSKLTVSPLDKWALKIFFMSTLFVVLFSVEAIHHWPSPINKISILLACIIPLGMVVSQKIPMWIAAKQAPREVIWVLLVMYFGLISTLLSEVPGASIKSIVLFIATGPAIFVTVIYLFETKDNQRLFLWMVCLIMVILICTGAYEYTFAGDVRLFSGNSLPAGTLLILFLAGPLVLLSQT